MSKVVGLELDRIENTPALSRNVTIRCAAFGDALERRMEKQ